MVNLKMAAIMVVVALAASTAIVLVMIAGVQNIMAQDTNATTTGNMTNATTTGNMTNATSADSGQISGVARGL
jgi:ribosomal protein S5